MCNPTENSNKNNAVEVNAIGRELNTMKRIAMLFFFTTIVALIAVIALALAAAATSGNSAVDASGVTKHTVESKVVEKTVEVPYEVEKIVEVPAEGNVYVEIPTAMTVKPPMGENPCDGMKPDLPNVECKIDDIFQTPEQAGANVTKGYNGLRNTTATPITTPYFEAGLCPVNVHWHLGAEHYSLGQFDETGTGPSDINERRQLAGKVREGFQCKHYDDAEEKFTKEFDWQHCEGMEVGQTYEVHWPHSKMGACGTINQYQTPFYDGVFCNIDLLDLSNTHGMIGVQAQIFTIVNDEEYYYPDLMRGMIVDGKFGADMAMYTGSTTGTSRDNTICSQYAPITWQVDRECHMISASTFDKMCADMKAQRDDMSDDLHAHGSRELVSDENAANNHANLRRA